MTPGASRRADAGSSSALRVLLLADDRRDHADTVRDHLFALRALSRHRIWGYNPRGSRRSVVLNLDRFDAVVIHYSLVLTSEFYFPSWLRKRIVEYSGPIVVYLQDEYRWVDRQTQAMREIGVDVLFSCVPPHAMDVVYGDRLRGVDVRPTLTGYVPERLVDLRVPPLSERPIDVGYRGRALPYWYGALGQEKRVIGQQFLRQASACGLALDIDWTEQSRLYGRAWQRFLASCRATLGTESGASIVDHDGAAEQAVLSYLARRPEATFAEVAEAVLHRWEGKAEIRTISPRIFESAAHRAALVLYPGEYAGILEPWEHYVPLERDGCNIDEVISTLRDRRRLQAIVDSAYRDLIASRRYDARRLATELDAALEAHARPARSRLPRTPRLLLKAEPMAHTVADTARGRATRAVASLHERCAERGGAAHVLMHPLHYAGRARLIVSVLERHADLRAVVLATARTQRRVPASLIVDVVKLGLVREALGTPSLPALELALVGGTLELRSLPAPPMGRPVRPAIPLCEVRALHLDHSAVAPSLTVTVGGATYIVGLDEPGSYTFRAIGRQLSNDDPLARDLLASLVQGGERATRNGRRPRVTEAMVPVDSVHDQPTLPSERRR